METNTVVTNAIAAVNDNRRRAIEQAVVYHINNIDAEMKQIEILKKSIEGHQQKLNAIADDVISQTKTLGRELGTSQNETTIAKVIADLNTDRQKLIAQRSKVELDSILSYQTSIAQCEKRIADYRKQVADLKFEEVTPAVLG